MSPLVWGVEWRRLLADRKALAFGALWPLVVAVVIGTGGLSGAAAPMAYVVLVVAFGALRAARSTFDDEASGLARRLLNGGVSPAGYMIQKAGASMSATFLSLLPAVGVVLVLARASVVDFLLLTVLLALGLWISGVLGVAIGAAADSSREMLTASGLTLLMLLHASGVFHTGAADEVVGVLAAWSPFAALHQAFVSLSASGAGTVRGLSGSLVWAALTTVALAAVATPLASRRAAGSGRAA